MDIEKLGVAVALAKKSGNKAQEAYELARETKETADAAAEKLTTCLYIGRDGRFYIDRE